MNFLATERKNGVATRSRKVSSLRSFFNYLTNKTGKLSKIPVQELETPKLKKALPKYLTLEQCLELLSKLMEKTANAIIAS
jgi:site-specific recombinase XerD